MNTDRAISFTTLAFSIELRLNVTLITRILNEYNNCNQLHMKTKMFYKTHTQSNQI